MPHLTCTFALTLALLWTTAAEAQTKRRVYVLHSGMHVILAPKDKDHAARTLSEVLKKSGIAERDCVFLDSPFPTATWSEMVPKDGLVIYLNSTDPKSRVSQEAYVRLHKALQAKGVTQKDDIVWIGHSAGGQIGMTMAHIACHLDKFPALAKKAQPYHFDTVVTLGAAVGANPTPKEVKLRHYCSDGDTMVNFLSNHGDLVAESVKSKVRFRVCCDLGSNAMLRVFPGIEHPNWYGNAAVIDRILCEADAKHCPAWRKTHADASHGGSLSQLISRSLEAELHLSLEEDRH